MNKGVWGFIWALVGVLMLVFLGFAVWSISDLAQGQEEEKPSDLAPAMLAGMTRLWAQVAVDSNVLGASGLAAVGAAKLADALYDVLHPTITDVSVLWNDYLSKPDEYEQLIESSIEQAIQKLGGNPANATAEIKQIATSLKDQIPAIRLSNIDMIDNGAIRSVVSNVIGDNPGASADELLNQTIERIKKDILGCEWNENDIATKVISALTGIPISEVAGKSKEEIEQAAREAIPGISQEALDLLGAAQRRVEAHRMVDLEERVSNLNKRITELEGQVADLNEKTAMLSRQLGALQQRLGELDSLGQDVAALKGRKDTLPLILAIIALVLGVAALGLTVTRKQRA